jgi:uncharacterized protein (TIGR03083 family)
MNAHTEVSELLGAWALDACDHAEQVSVEAHLLDCAECAVQARRLRAAASWLSVDRVQPAPVPLRQATLARALVARPPALLETLVEAFAGQVNNLARLLESISPDDWRRPQSRHGDVAGVVNHLADNDGMLAADIGLLVPLAADDAPTGRRWRGQADLLIEALAGESDLDRPVRMAGRGEPVRRPLRDALVQRAFETWVHFDDVAGIVGRPPHTPSPEQVRRIVDLAARLLPAALAAHGVDEPDRVGRLVLTGLGGPRTWTVPLGGSTPTGAALAFTVTADAVEFARLVANRKAPEAVRYDVTGDTPLAARVLQIAATLGCD